MESTFRKDLDQFFGSEAALEEFGGRPEGLSLLRNTLVQLVLNPGLLAVGLYRMSRWFYLRDMDIPSRICDRVNEFFCGIQITGRANFGPGLEIHHPQGIVISPVTTGGKNCILLGAAVTTGVRDPDHDPYGQTIVMGDNVMVATGAKILGPVVIGSNVKVGPNVVLMEDVPDDCTVVVGARAKIIPHKSVSQIRSVA